MSHVHFVGFRGDEFARATRIWGQPDFVHMFHDNRMWGDIDTDNDTVVFGPKGHDTPGQHSWQDHELW